MSEGRSASPADLTAPRASTAATVPCSTCGAAVDPLRAARVAIFFDRFRYFCGADCRERFVPAPAARTEPRRGAVPLDASARSSVARPPNSSPELAAARELAPSTPAPLVLISAAGLGVAAWITAVLPFFPTWAGAPASVLASAALVSHSLSSDRARALRGGALELVAPVVGTLAALAMTWLRPTDAPLAFASAGVLCAAAATSMLAVWQRERELDRAAERVERALAPVDERLLTAGSRLRPGEEVVLESGDRSPADVVVSAGQAEVEPWLDAPFTTRRSEGEAIIAGARVVDGAVRCVVRWAGMDRAWARLTRDPERRADRQVRHAKLAARAASAGGGATAAIAGLLALYEQQPPLAVLGYAALGFAALAGVGLREHVAVRIARGVSDSLFHGITLRDPGAFDRAGRVSFAVFCAQGTLLRGDYSVASVEPAKGMTSAELLSLAAGAYAAVSSPIGNALARSAQAHDVRPDAARSHNHQPGLGVTAVTSSGRPIVVGSRALLLACHVSVASAEGRIGELESVGREVVLVALDGRWVGLIALQDALQSGARGAVQHLLDAGVEPVLLSGEARETCRALGRHLGIDHVRPEVLPEQRAQEIRRLAQQGAAVAVIGKSSLHDDALAAAPLSIDIDPTGAPLERWDIEAVSGDVRDAALAISMARKTIGETRSLLIGVLAGAVLALLLVALGAPAWILPLPSLASMLLPRAR